MPKHPKEIDKYQIRKHIGSGAFGNVYLADDRVLDARKAIKVLDVPNPKDFVAHFEEAQILNKCRHKHIVKINDANVYKVNGELKVIIDMEYLPGGSLEKKMKRNHISSVGAVKFFIDVLFGLEHAHNQEILHRDIKPGNIMIDKKIAKLSDFGLATTLKSGTMGSPYGYITHLAPEVFKKRQTTKLTDIFATGISLFRVASNIVDWDKTIQSISNLNDRIKKGQIVKAIGYPDYMPKKLKRVINRACNPSPSKRFQSAKDMRQALEKIPPSIKWVYKDQNCWIGECCNSGALYEVSKATKKKRHEVVVKKKNRKIGKHTRFFKDKIEADHYLESHVALSSFK